jgi:hypothetical protein
MEIAPHAQDKIFRSGLTQPVASRLNNSETSAKSPLKARTSWLSFHDGSLQSAAEQT